MQQESSHICMKQLFIQKEKQFTLATQPYVKISNFTQQHAILKKKHKPPIFHYHTMYVMKSNAKPFKIQPLNIRRKGTISNYGHNYANDYSNSNYYFNYGYYINYDHYSNYDNVTKAL